MYRLTKMPRLMQQKIVPPTISCVRPCHRQFMKLENRTVWYKLWNQYIFNIIFYGLLLQLSKFFILFHSCFWTETPHANTNTTGWRVYDKHRKPTDKGGNLFVQHLFFSVSESLIHCLTLLCNISILHYRMECIS